MDNKKQFGDYPRHERFVLKDTIAAPHPYCITPRHVVEASDNFSGMLGLEAIKACEEKKIYCGICKGELKFEEHVRAILIAVVGVTGEFNNMDDGTKAELADYLRLLRPFAERDGFAGFAFCKGGV